MISHQRKMSRVGRWSRVIVLATSLLTLFMAATVPADRSAAAPSTKRAESPDAAFTGQRGLSVGRTFGSPVKDLANPEQYAKEPYAPRWSESMPRVLLKDLVDTGFDFLRIGIDPGPLLAADHITLEDRIRHITEAVDHTLAAGLKVVVDIHPSETHPLWNLHKLTAGPNEPAVKRFLEVMRTLAGALARFDAKQVALEVFNEPPSPCEWRDRPSWSTQLKTLTDQVRVAAPRLTLLLSGPCYASMDGLHFIKPAQFDRNTIFVVHFYEPRIFTHQGFWASSSEYIQRLKFPPDPAQKDAMIAAVVQRVNEDTSISESEKNRLVAEASKNFQEYFANFKGYRAIDEFFDGIAKWAVQNEVDPRRIIIGEFGVLGDVYGKIAAAPEDRARWIEAVRTAAERRGFRWAVWAYSYSFGIILGDTEGPLDPVIVKALGLKGS
jgi:endoglucanase